MIIGTLDNHLVRLHSRYKEVVPALARTLAQPDIMAIWTEFENAIWHKGLITPTAAMEGFVTYSPFIVTGTARWGRQYMSIFDTISPSRQNDMYTLPRQLWAHGDTDGTRTRTMYALLREAIWYYIHNRRHASVPPEGQPIDLYTLTLAAACRPTSWDYAKFWHTCNDLRLFCHEARHQSSAGLHKFTRNLSIHYLGKVLSGLDIMQLDAHAEAAAYDCLIGVLTSIYYLQTAALIHATAQYLPTPKKEQLTKLGNDIRDLSSAITQGDWKEHVERTLL